MFKIVVLVFVMISGQPLDEPFRFTRPESFAGLDKCQSYLHSAAFMVDRSRLSALVTATVRQTQAAKAKAEEDESIPPVMDTAITASCEDDNRI